MEECSKPEAYLTLHLTREDIFNLEYADMKSCFTYTSLLVVRVI